MNNQVEDVKMEKISEEQLTELQGHVNKINQAQPINDFTKPISRSEWENLSNRNKRKYNRFAMANNLPVYERHKNRND